MRTFRRYLRPPLEPTMITSEKTCSASLFTVLQRTGLYAVVALFAGCAGVTRPVGVTSPPPPVMGSAPIIAYDDYARALVPLANGKVIAVIVPSSIESPLEVVTSPEPQTGAGNGAVGGAY